MKKLECILWAKGADPKKYGTKYKGAPGSSHVMAWEEAYGPVPQGIVICHSCDTPACVRLGHLFAGTPAANSRDMVNKGRGVWPRRGRPRSIRQKIKKSIHFEDDHMAFLKKQAKRLDISIAEYLRRLIDKERGA